VLIAALVVLFRALLGDAGGGPSPLANVDPDSGNPLHVEIRVPSAGARLSAADPTVVFVQSFGGGVVVRFELWVDGKLTRYQLSPESDPTMPATGRLQWLPDAPGTHVLVARALDAEGRTGRSRPVVVEAEADPNEGLVPVTVNLQPGNTVESIAQALGTTPDMVRRADPATEPQPGDVVVVFLPPEKVPEGYIDDDALPAAAGAPPVPGPEGEPEGGAPPAEAVATPTTAPSPDEGPAQAGDGDAPDPLPWGFRRLDDPEPPTAPEGLSASLGEGCEVRLEWTDTSDSETGFRVYRFGGHGDFRLIGDLEANILTYTDRVPLGGHYEYYVASVNAGGESDSNLVAVDVPDDQCAITVPFVMAMPMYVLQFEATSLATNTQWDNAHCYLSLARLEPYARIPEDEDAFLAPTAGGGWDIEHHAAGISRFMFSQPGDESVPVRMECWARRGEEEPELLGSFAAEHPSEEWDGRDLFGATDGFRVVYHIEPYENLGRAQFALTDSSVPAPSNVRQLRPEDDCGDYLDLEGGNPSPAGEFETRLLAFLCTRDPESLMSWHWAANDVTSRSDIDGFRIYFNPNFSGSSREEDEEGWMVLGEVGSINQLFPIPTPPCEAIYAFQVTAFVRPEEGREERESPSSAPPFTLSGPHCPAAIVEFTLDSLAVGETDDGEEIFCDVFVIIPYCWTTTDTQLEAYGWGGFYVWRGGELAEHPEAGEGNGFVFWADRCAGGFTPCFGPVAARFFPWPVGDRELIEFEDQNLRICRSVSEGAFEDCTGFGPNHNSVSLVLHGGDAVEFWFTLRDEDDSPIGVDDTWCGTEEDYSFDPGGNVEVPIYIGPYTFNEWATIDQDLYWENDDYEVLSDQDARCGLTIHVRGAVLEDIEVPPEEP
jgi:hypothetical protein